MPSRLRALLLAGTMLAMAPSLAGCIVAAAGAGAAGGYSVLAQELSPEQQVRDASIKAVIKQSWGNYNQEVAADLTATVYDGRPARGMARRSGEACLAGRRRQRGL
jgi:hypothetical protein